MHAKLQIRNFWLLSKRDLTIHFRKNLKDSVVNSFIWVLSTLVIKRYVLPFFGLNQDYSTFILAGIVASVGGFEAMFCAFTLIADFEGNRQIS